MTYLLQTQQHQDLAVEPAFSGKTQRRPQPGWAAVDEEELDGHLNWFEEQTL
jgi:hypothetical protein